MSTKCSQCSNAPAIYQINGHPLCLNCAYKVQQMNYMEQMQLMQHMNYLTGEMEAAVGMPGLFPRYEIPKPPPVIKQEGDVTLNNINIEKSVIGAVNTGNIGQIDVALSNIKNSGNDDFAKAIKEFTEAVLNSQELISQTKNEIIEQISVLANQAALPKEGRKDSVIRIILDTISNNIQNIPILIDIFERLRKLFN